MRTTPLSLAAAALLAAGSIPASAPAADTTLDPADAELSLTIYSNAQPGEFDPQHFIARQRAGLDPQSAREVPGFGVVRGRISVELPEGRSTLHYTDVAQFIDPTTVSFLDLDHPDGTAVLEQQFEFDLVSPHKLLQRYVDRQITLEVPGEDGAMRSHTGTLLSAVGNQIVLRDEAGGLTMIPHSDEVQIRLDALPEGLMTRPTLSWLVHAEEPGERDIRTSYQTDGITWRADYNMILNEDDTAADVAAWVTLLNLSGTAYDNAQLRLIAGDVHRVEPERPRHVRQHDMARLAVAEAEAFEQEAFFDYHLYTLPRRTDVPANATKQLTLFPTAADVPVEKVRIYQGAAISHWHHLGRAQPRTDRGFATDANQQIETYIRFTNSEANNLGMPLPRGKFRLYKENPNDGSLEFIGEDLIDHTPRDEELMVKVGKAFDLVGERRQSDFTIDTDRRVMTESFTIELRNRSEEAATITVKEPLYRWRQWEITEASHDYEQIDARTIHFDVDVEAGATEQVSYTVRYTW